MLVSSMTGQAQGHVGAGESWSCEFSSLSFVGPQALPAPNLYGGVHLSLSSVAPNTHYTLAIFENSLSDVPMWVTDSAVNQSASAGGNGIWQDLQGWAQLHVLAGEVTIDQVQFDARLPIDSSQAMHYQSIIAVPEPTCFSLFTLAGGLIAVGRTAKRWWRTSRST